jgi:phosphatidylglycerol:prolipoprotein diacylglycerol transferase
MRRVLFSIGSVPVYSYPALLYGGLVVGVFAGAAAAPFVGLARERFTAAVLVLLVPALAGARLWFVLAHWQTYRRELRRVWRRSEGGMALYGGLLLALAVSPPVLASLGLQFPAFWDAATFTMLIGMAFTRIGCLLNGCCGGRQTGRWLSLRLPDHTGAWAARYPTQLLEAALAIALLGAEFLLLDVEPFRGAVFLFALVCYSAVRFALEPLRAPRLDESTTLGPRVVSVLILAAAMLVIFDLTITVATA